MEKQEILIQGDFSEQEYESTTNDCSRKGGGYTPPFIPFLPE